MSQTSVPSAGQAIGVAGQIADSGPHDIVSGFNTETTLPIPFGVGVRAGTVPDGYLNATGFSNSLPIEGVNIFDFNHAKLGVADSNGIYAGDLGASGLMPKAGMQIMRKGRVLVPVEQKVLRGDRAWCRGVATGASAISGNVGYWNGTGYDAGASYYVDCRQQAVFRSNTYTAADGTTLVAVLEVDFTNKA